MPSIQIKTDVSFNELFKGVEQLSADELDKFIKKLVSLKTRRLGTQSAKIKTELTQNILARLPENEQKKYDDLTSKRQAGTLTQKEHQILGSLIEKVEEIELKKAQSLMTLAQIKNLSPDELLKKLIE